MRHVYAFQLIDKDIPVKFIIPKSLRSHSFSILGKLDST